MGEKAQDKEEEAERDGLVWFRKEKALWDLTATPHHIWKATEKTEPDSSSVMHSRRMRLIKTGKLSVGYKGHIILL